MRMAVALLMMLAGVARAQQDIWSHVDPHFNSPQLAAAKISNSRELAIRNLLRQNRTSIGWECGGDQLAEMLNRLKFETMPISAAQDVLLVEAGAGCARGGQGSNGAMWLVRFDGDAPALMATPKGGFNGWLFAIQPATSHGYRDIILGWSMGAGGGTLSYFRYDGKSYRAIGSAEYSVNDDDSLKFVPLSK